MPIASVFNAGVEGYGRATQAAEQATRNINRATLDQQDASQQQQSRQLQAASSNEAVTAPVSQTPNVTEEIVNLKVAEFSAKANAKTIQTADEVLGTLIDVRV